MKFKVGDKVKIVADDSGTWKESIGKVGVITYVDTVGEDVKHPYWVRISEADSVPCNDNELELITDEPTPTVGITEELLTLMATRLGNPSVLDDKEVQAAFWIERRHGSTEALAYLKEALKDG